MQIDILNEQFLNVFYIEVFGDFRSLVIFVYVFFRIIYVLGFFCCYDIL